MNQIAELLPRSNIAARPRRREQDAPVRAIADAVRARRGGIARSRRLRQPLRAREAGLDRARPGHRHPARPHQGTQGGARRVRPPGAADPVRRARRQARSSRCSCCSCPSTPPSSTCELLSELAQMFSERSFRERLARRARRRATCATRSAAGQPDRRRHESADAHLRQVSVERLFADNQERLGLRWLAGRDGGNRVLTGEAALKPTIGQVGHMNFIHPFRVQMLGAAEIALPARRCRRTSFSTRSDGCSPPSWSRSSSPTARTCRRYLLERAATRTTSRC